MNIENVRNSIDSILTNADGEYLDPTDALLSLFVVEAWPHRHTDYIHTDALSYNDQELIEAWVKLNSGQYSKAMYCAQDMIEVFPGLTLRAAITILVNRLAF